MEEEIYHKPGKTPGLRKNISRLDVRSGGATTEERTNTTQKQNSKITKTTQKHGEVSSLEAITT